MFIGLCTDYCLFGGHAKMCKRLLHSLLEEPTGTESRFVHSHLACTVNSHIVPSKIFFLCYSTFNIYKQPVIPEARRALPVVVSVKHRVEELLVEWPDHPGLNQVSTTCVSE